jgi:hypothetical protein
MPCFAGSIQYKKDYVPLPACLFLSLCLWAPPCTEYQEYRFCDRFVSYLQNCIFYSEVCYCILLFFIVRFTLLFESPRHIDLFIHLNLSRLVALVHSSAFATSSRWLPQDFWGLHNSTRQVFCFNRFNRSVCDFHFLFAKLLWTFQYLQKEANMYFSNPRMRFNASRMSIHSSRVSLYSIHSSSVSVQSSMVSILSCRVSFHSSIVWLHSSKGESPQLQGKLPLLQG